MAMKSTKSSGSYAHRGERVGPGEVAGAGELPARGPGRSKETKGKMPPASYPSRTPAPAQKSVPNHTRGREE